MLSYSSALLLAMFIIGAVCDQNPCKMMLPMEMENNLVGYCCVTSKNIANKSAITQFLKKKITEKKLEDEVNTTGMSGMNFSRSKIPGQVKLKINVTGNRNVTEGGKIQNKTIPDLDNRNNVNAPITCTDGYKPDHDGKCVEVF